MEKTLVILAAGMGSRFGGLKQIEPVGPSGEIIADYSIYDAIQAGFTKVVFVIKKENLSYFQEKIIPKYQDKIKVEFAFQSFAGLEDKIPASRIKMLGTAHALYCAKSVTNEPFVMINSDDFYGRSSYILASQFIDKSTDPYEYLTINYPYSETKSKNGKVNRGLVKLNGDEVVAIDECSIEEIDGVVIATHKNDKTQEEIAADAPVSMNFLVFKPTIFEFIKRDLQIFLQNGITEDNELILTDVIKKCIQNREIKYKAVTTDAKWFGMTYKEDLEDLKQTLKEMIDEGIYPEKLWEE